MRHSRNDLEREVARLREQNAKQERQLYALASALRPFVNQYERTLERHNLTEQPEDTDVLLLIVPRSEFFARAKEELARAALPVVETEITRAYGRDMRRMRDLTRKAKLSRVSEPA